MRSIVRILVLLFLLLPLGCTASSPADWLFDLTGEEEFLGQLRGILQLPGNLTRPQPQTAAYEAVAHAGVSPFGINTFLEQEVEVWKRERALEMISGAGFHWIRQGFPWEDLEIHGRGDYEDRRHEPHRSAWEKYDNIVDLAEQQGLEVIALLSNPPSWSRADGNARGTYAPPDDIADFGNYVHTVVSRYRGRIRYYQIWNEPNIYPEWGEQPVDPEAYTELLCLAYRRAREADPNAVIISGALAQTISLQPGPGPGLGLNDLAFLQRMYGAGAASCFDILAVNDYVLWSAPSDRRMPPTYVINFGRPLYLRDLMVANGDSSKPIWMSEMNSNALPADHPAPPSYGRVTLEQQARYAPLAYQRVQEEWPWVGVVSFWFFKRPSESETDQSWYYFRMVEPDFEPLPVYNSMAEYISGLTPTLYRGTHQEDHWALEWQGAWTSVADQRAMLGAYYAAENTGADGDRVSFVFEGSALTLVPGPGIGQIKVTIDGGPTQSMELEGEPVRLVSSWPEAAHVIEIVAHSGQVGIDSLLVQGQGPAWLLAICGVLVFGVWALARRLSLARA